jgi:D-lyxose ketol-isomerase
MTDKIDKMQLSEPQRGNAIKAFKDQIDKWGLVMPKTELLVLDFGLGRFQEIGLIESWIINEFEAGYCGKYMFVFDKQTCPMHSHRQKHETFFVVKGKIQVTTDSGVKILEQGNVLPLATDVKHSFTGIGNALILEISKPCDINDNQFIDNKIMHWLKKL